MLHTTLSQWQPFLALFLLTVFWIWESMAPFFARRHRIRHAVRNLTISLLNGLVLALVFAGLTINATQITETSQLGLLHWLGLDGTMLFLSAFILIDLWTYWWHRLNHGVPFLWRFHRMHHSDPEMDVTTATRFHVGEIIFSSTIRLLLIPTIGIPIGVVILYDFLQLPVISFHHANISLSGAFDKGLRYFIVSPFMHKVHHSRSSRETDSNFSSLLSVWDRLFGSYVEKEDYAGIVFGLDDFGDDRTQTIKGLLSTPGYPVKKS